MGTNYFTIIPGDGRETHLGKSSCGSKFILRRYPDGTYSNWSSMKTWLSEDPRRVIYSESGKVMPVPEFIALVESKQSWKSSAEEYPEFVEDRDGYEFMPSEFR